MGTINVFEASRSVDTVRAIINITSDKCYENKEWPWGYREIDPVGGFDPYSVSKACSELITNCWRNSFFNVNDQKNIHHILLASCRAGNVIGGGDWAVDRLIPDLVRAAARGTKLKIRNSQAIRPWQHVLEPLSGYLLLGQKLLEGYQEFAEAWNFGPSSEEAVTVREIVNLANKIWPEIDIEAETIPKQLHEADVLKLDCSKSRTKLKWIPLWNLKTSVQKTVEWYRSFYELNQAKSLEDILEYIKAAKIKKLSWAK
jgi:CDP-glucose 4,6-dehydratase